MPDNEGGRMPGAYAQMDADSRYEKYKELVCDEHNEINA